MKRCLILLLGCFMAFGSLKAQSIQEYTVKVGEVVKLEIPSDGRALLSRATNRRGEWDVNETYLEVESSSWDHAYVRGKAATSGTTPVQLTVTFNMNGHYGDHYYASYRVKVLPSGPTSITVRPSELRLTVGETYTLQASITGTAGTYKWSSDYPSIVSVEGDGLQGHITAKQQGASFVRVRTNTDCMDACYVIVKEKDTDIETVSNDDKRAFKIVDGRIEFDNDSCVSVYDVSGRIVFNGTTKLIDGLSKECYIIVIGGESHKVVIG